MNKDRRKKISDLISAMEDLKEQADNIASEEREYYDNMPENMQSGDKGQTASDAADALESAVTDLESAIDNLNNALGG